MIRFLGFIALLMAFFTVYSQVDFQVSYVIPCARNQITFTPQNITSAIDNIVWDFGDGNSLTVTTTDPVTHSYSMEGRYTVTMTVNYPGGGYEQASKQVEIYDKPKITFNYTAPSLVCAPNDTVYLTVNLDNTIISNDLQFTIDWGDGSSETYDVNELGKQKMHIYKRTSCGNQITIGNTTITDKFLITISATNLCTTVPEMVFKPVDIKSAPNVGFEIDQRSDVQYDSTTSTFYICEAGEVILKNLSYGTNNCLQVDNVVWTIYDENNNIITQCVNTCLEEFTYNFTQYGRYTIELTQENACGQGSVTNSIVIRQPPDVSFYIKEYAYCYPTTLTFINTSADDVIEFWWDFIGDSSNIVHDTIKTDHTYDYLEQGDYTIKLWGYDGYCYNYYDTTVSFTQRCKDIYVPNAFLPESSNPDLKVFKPKAKDLVDYRIDIYDLYGRHIWSSTKLTENGEPAEGWDGTCPDGTPCEPGTYIWSIKATISYGEFGEFQWDGQVYNKKGKRSTSGTVVLIR